jgi:diguanylate cyclase (GGDEF)-like protein
MLRRISRRVASNVNGAREAIPGWVVVPCVAALAVPVLAALAGRAGDADLLLWLVTLVPVFLLAYHSGWRGAAGALALGVATLAATAGLPIGPPGRPGDLPLLLGVATVLVAVSIAVGWLAELFHRERDRAERLALTDELTGMANRRYARVILDQEFAAARRGRALALVMLDIDQFKAYNDLHGHGAGDDALRVFAAVLQRTTRQMNLSARYGGEEFISILSDTNTDGALIFVERVRRSLAEARIATGAITFSAGVAAYEPGMAEPEELVAAADAALYRAKEGGRDRAEVFGEEEPATVA